MPANEVHAMRRNPSQPQSWEETFRETAREREDWSDFESTVADGLDPKERWSVALCTKSGC